MGDCSATKVKAVLITSSLRIPDGIRVREDTEVNKQSEQLKIPREHLETCPAGAATIIVKFPKTMFLSVEKW